MEIKQTLVRQKDCLTDILGDFIDRDSLSIIEDFLDNPVVSIKNVIEYDGRRHEYSRKVRKENRWYNYYCINEKNNSFLSYNSYTDTQKEHCKNILKLLLQDKNKRYNQKEISSNTDIPYGNTLRLVFFNMIETGLVRFNFKSYTFREVEDLYDDDNTERRFKRVRVKTIRSI